MAFLDAPSTLVELRGSKDCDGAFPKGYFRDEKDPLVL